MLRTLSLEGMTAEEYRALVQLGTVTCGSTSTLGSEFLIQVKMPQKRRTSLGKGRI